MGCHDIGGTACRGRGLRYSAAVALAVTLVQLACTEPPPSPTSASAPTLPPAVNLTGGWQGQYLEVACQSLVSPVSCTSRGKTERRRTILLTVTQDGAAVTGQWKEDPLEFQGTLGGTIGGQVSGRSVTLTGALFPVGLLGSPVPAEQEPWRLTDFNAQVGEADSAITGSFALVSVDANGRETMRLRNDIVALSRVR